METQLTETVMIKQEESSPLQEWSTPGITRIELKRTLLGSGGITDGEVPSAG